MIRRILRRIMVLSSGFLVAVGVFSALGLCVVLPMMRVTPRQPTPESLGDFNFSPGHALVVVCAVAIGIGNAVVMRRAKADWAGGPSPVSAAVGVGEVLAAVVWGWSVAIAVHRYVNWLGHPGDPGLLGLQAVMAAALLLKGVWTSIQEWRSGARQSLSPGREGE